MCCDVTPFSLVNTHDVLGNMTASMSSPRQTLKTEILILKTADCAAGDERGGVLVWRAMGTARKQSDGLRFVQHSEA